MGPVPQQPRQAPAGVPLRRRQGALGGLGQNAGDAAAHPAGHALRLPGGGAGHDRRAVRLHPGLRRPRRQKPLPPDAAGGCHPRRGPGPGPAGEPGQRPHPHAVGCLPQRGLYHRHPLAEGEPQLQDHQRRGPAGGPPLHPLLLQGPHRPAEGPPGPEPGRPGAVRPAPGPAVLLPPPLPGGGAAGAPQLLRRGLPPPTRNSP